MERKSSRELFKRILNSLMQGPKSINEIATDTTINWESVKLILESLKESGVLTETSVGNKRVFSINENYVLQKREDTYFGLPLASEEETKIDSLFSKIRELWMKHAGVYPGKTQMQKTLVKVNNVCKLKIPIGYYLYGCLCVKRYDTSLSYNHTGFPNEREVMECITGVVQDYSKEVSVYDLRMRQYKDDKKNLYLIKELILTLLAPDKLNIKEIATQLHEFISALPRIEDNDARMLVSEFVGSTIQILSNVNKDSLLPTKLQIMKSFNSLWELVAMYQFSNDLGQFYSKEILIKYFMPEIGFQKLEVIEHLTYLNDFIPIEKEPEDENYLKLKALLSKGKTLTEEDRVQREKELEGKDSSYILGKFGLD